MKTSYALESYDKNEPIIFLAGPSYRPDKFALNKVMGVESWRKRAVDYLQNSGFKGVILVPEYRDEKQPEGWTYSRQVSWELDGLKAATVILFWIPRDMAELPALTTNIEFGEWCNSGKIVCGAPKTAVKNEYIKERCSRLDIPWSTTLEDCVDQAFAMLFVKDRPKIWFTSDTHWGHERTLELSKRPFASVKEMDAMLVANWNKKVSSKDKVYHLGDFGDPNIIKHLSFSEFWLIRGNYDDEQTVKALKSWGTIQDVGIVSKDLYLIHAPEDYKKYKSPGIDPFILFGHIHSLQKVKRNGLNVGVDCHNFAPIDMGTVDFYRNAILNHYDENVFRETL